MNPLVDVLREKGVDLPESPQNYSEILSSSGVNRSFVIVMTGRSGSTWLASAMRQSGIFPHPEEYFSDEGLPFYWDLTQPQNFSDVFRGVVNTYSRNDMFGFKINPSRLVWLDSLVDMATTFPQEQCAWIDLRRINIVRQSFSFARAILSGVWHEQVGEASVERQAYTQVDLERTVWDVTSDILRQELTINDWFALKNITPMKLSYEEIMESRHQVLIRVAATIMPDRNHSDLAGLDGTTRKLASEDDQVQNEFIAKYAVRINAIMNRRGNLTRPDIYRLCHEGLPHTA